MGRRAAATFPLPEVTRSALAPGARGRGFFYAPVLALRVQLDGGAARPPGLAGPINESAGRGHHSGPAPVGLT